MAEKTKSKKRVLIGRVHGKDVVATAEFMEDLKTEFPDERERKKFLQDFISKLAKR